MKRVASLYLPHWSIDRVRRAERTFAPSPPDAVVPDLPALKALGDAARGKQCDAPRNSGWRPGARWAREGVSETAKASREEIERHIAALPAHQRPPMRELGRRSEAAEHPFRLPTRSMGPDSRGGSQAADRAVTVPRLPAPAPAPASRDAAPLVIVHRTGARVEIAAACPVAQGLGLVRGMALTQARASVPELDVRDADPHGDKADLTRLAIALARRWTPIVAVSDTDGLFLDMTGVAHLHGGEDAMARRIARLLARLGVTARIAVADTAGAAWAVARYGLPRRPSESWGLSDKCDTFEQRGPSLRWGDGVGVLPPGHHIPAIAALPPEALRLAPDAIDLMRRFGIDTVGALAALPRAPLVRRFGADVARRIDQASGALPEPLDPVIPPILIAATRRFAEPIATAEAIGHWLGVLVPDLADALAKAGLGARALLLVADRVDHQAQVVRIGLARPTRDAAHLLRLLARRIETIEPGYGIDALTLHVRRAEPLGAQGLTDLADPASADLAPLVDTLANRIGGTRVWRQAPFESDVPERSVAPLPPLDIPGREAARLKPDDVRRLDTRILAHPWHPRWPRPVRLLRRPEPVDNVLSAMPDGHPARFTWRGVDHRIVRGDGPERIAGEWWRRSAEHHAIRDYFQVEDEAGARYWLFRRGDGVRPETGDLAWYIHGTFA